MAVNLPELPYAKDALSPYVSANTLEFHHGKHHKTYVDNLNKLIDGTDLEGKTLEEIIVSSAKDTARVGIFNNAAQVWNHTFFFDTLTPEPVRIPSELEFALTRDFGSVEEFKARFKKAATEIFGSGWAWLCKKDDGSVTVCSTPNQDNPLMPVADCQGTPILGLDVWEHAYYLNYQNRRPDYIAAFWNVVNWDKVSELAQ